jgi:hypothetical protein
MQHSTSIKDNQRKIFICSNCTVVSTQDWEMQHGGIFVTVFIFNIKLFLPSGSDKVSQPAWFARAFIKKSRC